MFHRIRVDQQSLAELMTANLKGTVPGAHLLWLDIPRHGLPNRNSFFGRVEELYQGCLVHKVPFVITKPRGNYIDQLCEHNIAPWMEFLRRRNVQWTKVCSCSFEDEHRLKSLHFQVNVFTLNLPSFVCNSCEVSKVGHVLPKHVSSYWALYYTRLCQLLISTNREPLKPHQTRWASGASSEKKQAAPVEVRDSQETYRIRKPRNVYIGCVGPPPGLEEVSEQAIAFPTDSKERRKAREKEAKEAGTPLEVKKIKKHVEEHYDDCGEDLSSLGTEDSNIGIHFTYPDFIDFRCAYPNVGTDPDGPTEPVRKIERIILKFDPNNVPQPAKDGYPHHGKDHRAPQARDDIPCNGCYQGRRRNDWEHTRIIGECWYPYDTPVVWKCQPCIRHWNRDDARHTLIPGECSWAEAEVKRGGKHDTNRPKQPRKRASGDATARFPGTVDGTEIDEKLMKEIEERKPTPGASSSGSKRPSGAIDDDTDPTTRQPRKKWKSTGSGENPQDWTGFDLTRTLNTLKNATPHQCKYTLRKLHLRWWHASASQMKALLERAGVPKATIEMVDDVVDTCVSCRKWARPLPDAITSIEVADTFNYQVECDLLFIHRAIIFHMVDRCTRWHEARVIPDKSDDALIYAVDEWIGRHGPMKELICDGERGLAVSQTTEKYFKSKGTTFRERAPQQHARIVERRGALLRVSIHRVQEGMEQERIDVPFYQVLSECVFAGNALLSINGSSPYNAVYGRTPVLLPPIELLNDDGEIAQPTNHTVHRVRTLAIQAIVEGTARDKLQRAMKTRTLPPGEIHELKVGDSVDFYRHPGTKDVSGWLGPAAVTDISEMRRGTIKIKHKLGEMVCRCGDVRPHLDYLVFLTAPGKGMLPGNAHETAWSYIRHKVELFTTGQICVYGFTARVYGNTSKTFPLADTKRDPKMHDAVMFLAQNSLHREQCARVRVSKGIAKLTQAGPCCSSIVMYWLAEGRRKFIDVSCAGDVSQEINLRQEEPELWQQVRAFQTIEISDFSGMLDENVIPDEGGICPPCRNQSVVDFPPSEALSPIPEESVSSRDSFFVQDDPELRELIDNAERLHCFNEPIEELPSSAYDYSEEPILFDESCYGLSDSVPPAVAGYDAVSAVSGDVPRTVDSAQAFASWTPGVEEPDDCREIYFRGQTWKILCGVDIKPEADEVVVLKVQHKAGKAGKLMRKQIVVVKDDDLLTPDEIIKHKAEIEAAILEELKTWAKYKCFSRKDRNKAHNIIDCRWVLKWKYDREPLSAQEIRAGKVATVKKIIRARLTIRGFKDLDKSVVDTYAGTSQRYSQRMLVSECVKRKWQLVAADISKAFLQGVTYEELHKATGEPLREVNFYLPPASVPILKQVPGYESFDARTEVLHCDRPGTGSVDAPRCFSMKLAMVTSEICGMKASSVDPELCMLHKPDPSGKLQLVALMTKHVDDLKITGEREWIDWLLEKIQETFGKLKLEWNEFTNCGVHHVRNISLNTVTLDQIQYAKKLRSITHVDLTSQPSESDCCEELHQLYMSLLGALAYLYLTRVDVLVFISACQRYAHKPQIIHVKRLNTIVRWVQRNPQTLVYRPFQSKEQHLSIVADSAFKKEEEKGHSLRGTLYCRAEGQGTEAYHKGGTIHLFEYLCKAIRNVTRSTFSAELLGACDSADLGILINLMQHEIHSGPGSKEQARILRDKGGYAMPMVLMIDALSVFAAITATYIKHPAEKSLLSHIQFIREMLDSGVLDALLWIDTRDMLADGLTKGTIDRADLHQAMQGYRQFKHDFRIWQSKLVKRS